MSVVPKFSESRWGGTSRSRTWSDPEWPRIGIYCAARSHADEPWLSGSFEVSSAILEDRGTAYWAWRDVFATGDGYLIYLTAGARADARRRGEDSPTRGVRELVDDELYESGANTHVARAALEAGNFDEAEAINADEDAKRARVRSNVKPECGHCGDRLVLRAEKIQPVLATLWSADVLEISIGNLRRAYELAR